jgi:hypothetical protein
MHRNLARIFACQSARASRAQALAHGETPGTIARRLLLDEWYEPRPGVFGLVGSPQTTLSRMWEVQLYFGRVRFRGRSAAWLHGMAGVAEPDSLEVRVPIDAHDPGWRDVDVRRSYRYDESGEADYDGLLATPRAETVVDLAAVMSLAAVLAVAQDEMFHGRVTLMRLYATCGRGRKGSTRLRKALNHLADRRESILSVMAFEILVAAGLPAPECGVELIRGTGEVDLLYRVARYVLEPRGLGPHGQYRQAVKDRRKVKALRDDGWDVEVVDWEDVTVLQGALCNRVAKVLLAAGVIQTWQQLAPDAVVIAKYARRAQPA